MSGIRQIKFLIGVIYLIFFIEYLWYKSFPTIWLGYILIFLFLVVLSIFLYSLHRINYPVLIQLGCGFASVLLLVSIIFGIQLAKIYNDTHDINAVIQTITFQNNNHK